MSNTKETIGGRKTKPKNEGGAVGHGKGLIPSEPDARDFPISALLSDEMLSATTFPTSFIVPYAPPVTNQGTTPQCVAHASGGMKAQQDRRDNGLWFNFNKPSFFAAIGGTASGASLRAAMRYMLAYGYPIVTYDRRAYHKIAAYYAASLAHLAIKAAVMNFGPMVFGIRWPTSWSRPGAGGIVPAPSGPTGGHAILAIGWRDGYGLRFRQSWGTGWGAGGDCYIPMRYLSTADGSPLQAFEAWKTVDKDQ